jgi:hypothetical protein
MAPAEFRDMSLHQLLFEPTLLRSPLRIVAWWERRRLPFNLAVGATGVASIVYTNGLSLAVRGQLSLPPWQLIVAYGVAANVCFTLGWVTENLAERWLKRPVYGLGPAMFRHGMVFSIGLTLFPAVLMTFMAIGGLLFR